MADGVPFQEAIDFLAQKVNLPTKASTDLQHEAHARGFSVAGVTRDDMLADFRQAIEEARTGGITYQDFRTRFDEIVDRTGWKFRARGETEEERRDWRARVIYQTNMRTSYMAGRYKQMTSPEVLRYRPWWQYIHSGARHPRQKHLLLDGTILAAANPLWSVLWPPNGWGCGCWVKALSDRQLRVLGKTAPDPDPDLGEYESTDPRTKQAVTRYRAIGEGWEYNVGEAWLKGHVPPELAEPLRSYGTPQVPAHLPPLPEPSLVRPEMLLPRGLTSQVYVDAFLGEFGLKSGETREFRDRSGGILLLSQSMFDHRDQDGVVKGIKSDKLGRGQYARLLAQSILQPDEIWAVWAYGPGKKPRLARTYLKRVTLPDGKNLFVRFAWTKDGWQAVTGYDVSDNYIERQRQGALLFRRT